MSDRMVSLEDVAQNIARDTGAPIAVARESVYAEVVRLRVAIGMSTIEEANNLLSARGSRARIRRAA